MLGEVIHGYRVDRTLSADKGGFGDVYFATHVESGAEAVVKVLKPEMSARHDIVTRFFNEAKAAASVHHPGIVQIHNVGYHGDRAYLLMERLRGDDLENRLTAGPLPLDRALVFMRQAAGAVGAAHDRGIVHRDLKPANLFVVSDPDVIGGERVKVLDFGIAKLTVEAGAGKTQGVFGTPSYMSPEQCASTGAVDGRADLYSLGCIFYELVCGRPPFGHGGLEVIAAHLRDAPMPPRAVAPWVPPPVEQVILRLLEKQPDRRYASAAELVAAIDQAAAASGVAITGSALSSSNPSLGYASTAPSGPPDMSRPGAPSYPGAPSITSPPSSPPIHAATQPPRSSRGLAIGLGIVALAAVAIAVVVLSGGSAGRDPRGAAGSGASEKLAISSLPDAATPAVDAMRPIDADEVAAITPDATVVAAPQDAAAPADSLTSRPDPRSLLVQQADAELRAKHTERALELYARALRGGPEPFALIGQAAALQVANRCGEAHQSISQALSMTLPRALAAKAKALNGEIDACIQRLIDSKPGGTPAAGPSTADVEAAAALNSEGIQWMYGDKPELAAKKFQQAVARDPKVKYFVNLCAAGLQSGRLDDAMTACQEGGRRHPTQVYQDKLAKLIEKIREEATKQNLTLRPSSPVRR